MFAVGGCDDDGAMMMMPDLSMNPADMSATVDLATGINRGPTDIALNFEPNGLWWDAPGKTLYIVSSQGQIMKWTDDGGLSLFATVPFGFAPNSGDLGQIIKLSDGTFLVAVFGFGTTGGVVRISATGVSTQIAGLNMTRRRIGLSVGSDGTVYSGWFVGAGSGSPKGGVSKIDLNGGGETDLLVGLTEVVGVLAGSTDLFVGDEKAGILYRMPLSNMDSDGGTTAVLASVTNIDLMTFGPGNDIFSGGDGINRIKPDGTVTLFAPEMHHVKGVAYDPDNKRLFAAQPDATVNVDAGSMAVLHILPVDM
jgi:hypothetical protein